MSNKPKISDKFTIEDIHRIREWNYEQRLLLGKDEYNKKLNEIVAEIMKDLPKAKLLSI
ncbi:MAG: hypothetical protein FWG91_00465 [Lachnospiraceae bacterium]|nr:hypothetical protein [Lachnospiraceae bacterium]